MKWNMFRGRSSNGNGNTSSRAHAPGEKTEMATLQEWREAVVERNALIKQLRGTIRGKISRLQRYYDAVVERNATIVALREEVALSKRQAADLQGQIADLGTPPALGNEEFVVAVGESDQLSEAETSALGFNIPGEPPATVAEETSSAMTGEVFDRIGDLEKMVDEGRVPCTSRSLVNIRKFQDMMAAIKDALPEEIVGAQSIVRREKAIIRQAELEARRIRRYADDEAVTIRQMAEERAEKAARALAEQILVEARTRSREIVQDPETSEPVSHVPDEPPAAAAEETGDQGEDNGSSVDDTEDPNATSEARKFAEKHHIDLSEVMGTGRGGRIRKADVRSFLNNRQS